MAIHSCFTLQLVWHWVENFTHSTSARVQLQPYCLHFSWSILNSITVASCCLLVFFAAEWKQVGATVPDTVCSFPSWIQNEINSGPYLAATTYFARATEYQPVELPATIEQVCCCCWECSLRRPSRTLVLGGSD